MQMLRIHQWTKFVTPILLLGAATIVSGCVDLDEEPTDDLELRKQDQDPAETGTDEEDDLAEPNHPKGPKNKPGVIPGQYIVMLKKGADPDAAAAAVQATPEHKFMSVISGFSGTLNPGQLQALSQHEDVVRIEPDQVVTAAELQCPGMPPELVTHVKTSQEPWPAYSVDRVDQPYLPFSYSYSHTWSGQGVRVYIVDTWMQTALSDFGGRASAGYDGYPNEPSNGEACSGHATHVAGIVGGAKWGVAKNVELVSVEVLDCTGHGSWSRLLAGIDWIKTHKGNTPAVVNMSLGGSESWIVDSAVNDLAASGVFVAVAAGNDSRNACNYSPSGAANAMTVAANTSNDARASFSNYGSCVDIYAGGTNVTSDWPDGKPRQASGTSMASPHVAGVAALYKQAFGNASSNQIELDIETWATENKITGNISTTPNLLLHWPCSGSTE
jgi:subtilisin family serine protease